MSASTPLATYLSALEARDKREKASKQYIDAFTRLADRTADQAQRTPATAEAAPPSSQASSPSRNKWSSPVKSRSPAPQESPSSTVAQLRTELASARKARITLELQLEKVTTDLAELRTTSSSQQKSISELEKTQMRLEGKLKDKIDELNKKAKFVEDSQDELVSLELQLNVAEKDRDKLKRENEELTRRWVEKMEREARRMNERNEEKWQDDGGRRRD